MAKTFKLLLAYSITSYLRDNSGYEVHALTVNVCANPEVLINTGLLNHHSADPKTWGIEEVTSKLTSDELKAKYIRDNFGEVESTDKDLFMAVDYFIDRSNPNAIAIVAPIHIAAVIERLISDLDEYYILIRDGHVGDINDGGVLVTFELTEREDTRINDMFTELDRAAERDDRPEVEF